MSRHDERDDDLHDPTLHRLYRELPQELPAPGTDARLKAAARRAVAAGPRAPGRPFLAAHWRALGASAAAVTLAVALTAQWRAGEPGRLDAALAARKEMSAPAPASEPTAALPAEAPAVPRASPSPRRHDVPAAAARPRAGEADAAADAMASNALREEQRFADGAVDGAPLPEVAKATRQATEAEARQPAPVAALAPPPAAPAPAADGLAREAEAPAAAASGALATTRSRENLPARQEAKKAERAAADAAPAPAPQVPPPDYRALMAAGRPAPALAALPAADTPVLMVDRDLLRQWQAPGTMPACAAAAPAWLGPQALLCAALRDRAANPSGAAAWLPRLRAAGLLDGAFAYRRAAVEAVFFPPKE